MDRNFKISVTRKDGGGKVFRCKHFTLPEKIFRLFFGEIRSLMILVPEGTVSRVCITEEGGVIDGES